MSDRAFIPADASAVTTRLEVILKQQLDAMSVGNLGQIARLANEFDGAVANARVTGVVLSREQTASVESLRVRLALGLAAQKDAAAKQLAKMHAGMRILRAYGR